jgi:hypothetical protein
VNNAPLSRWARHLEFARVVREGFCFLGGILQDCVRLPQLEVAIHESRESAIGIDLQILRSLMAAGQVIDVRFFEYFATKPPKRPTVSVTDFW